MSYSEKCKLLATTLFRELPLSKHTSHFLCCRSEKIKPTGAMVSNIGFCHSCAVYPGSSLEICFVFDSWRSSCSFLWYYGRWSCITRWLTGYELMVGCRVQLTSLTLLEVLHYILQQVWYRWNNHVPLASLVMLKWIRFKIEFYSLTGTTHFLLTILTKRKFPSCEKLSQVDQYLQKERESRKLVFIFLGSLLTIAGWWVDISHYLIWDTLSQTKRLIALD